MRPMNLIYQQPSYYVLVHQKSGQSNNEHVHSSSHGFKFSSCIAFKDPDDNCYLAEIHENVFHLYKKDEMNSYEVTPSIKFKDHEGKNCIAHLHNMSFIINKSIGSTADMDGCKKEFVSDSIAYQGWYNNYLKSTFAQWADMV